jgi:hypothetical protein
MTGYFIVGWKIFMSIGGVADGLMALWDTIDRTTQKYSAPREMQGPSYFETDSFAAVLKQAMAEANAVMPTLADVSPDSEIKDISLIGGKPSTPVTRVADDLGGLGVNKAIANFFDSEPVKQTSSTDNFFRRWEEMASYSGIDKLRVQG